MKRQQVYAAPRQLDPPRQQSEIDIGCQRRRFGQTLPPDRLAGGRIGAGELDREADATKEGGVNVLTEVCRENRQTRKTLEPLQQEGDLDIRVSIMRVAHLATLGEQRIGFVEEERDPGAFRFVENRVEVFFGLADVLAYDLRQIDHVQVGIKRARWPGLPSSCRYRSDPRTGQRRRGRKEAARRSPIGRALSRRADIGQ